MKQREEGQCWLFSEARFKWKQIMELNFRSVCITSFLYLFPFLSLCFVIYFLFLNFPFLQFVCHSSGYLQRITRRLHILFAFPNTCQKNFNIPVSVNCPFWSIFQWAEETFYLKSECWGDGRCLAWSYQ